MWAWAVNHGPFGTINNTLNFFNTLVNNKLIEYTKLSTQTSWNTYYENSEQLAGNQYLQHRRVIVGIETNIQPN